MTDTTRGDQVTQNMDDDLRKQMEAALSGYFVRLKHARRVDDHNKQLLLDNAELLARVEEQKRALKHMELELLDGRRREAKALEDIGVLKGIMQTHGASIADVVGRLGEPLPPPNNGERRQRTQPDLAQLERLIDTDQAQRPGGEA